MDDHVRTLIDAARRRATVRLADGSDATLIAVKRSGGRRGRFTRARVEFSGERDGHRYTVPLVDVVEVLT